MLTIYGVYKSRALRTIWLAHELGIPFEHVPVLQKGKLSHPEAADAPINTASASFKSISDLGIIPMIKDGDLVLHESLAINLYLARKHGGPLAPADMAEEALMTMWSFYAATGLEDAAVEISSVFSRGNQETPEGKARVDKAVSALEKPFARLDEHLARHGYLVGGRFTVADLNMVECVRYADGHPTLLERHPALNSWLADARARPAYIRTWNERAAEK